MSKYVVLDLEMCNVPKSKRNLFNWTNEIIEIGAVLIDDSLEITDSFKTYVSPEFGELDGYIINLTGIKPKNLKGAPNFETALRMLLEWIPEGAVVVTWSDNDERQIRIESKIKGIYTPAVRSMFKGSLDCQALFSMRVDVPRVFSLSEALLITAVDCDEHKHEAQADAYNTALIFIKMQKETTLVLNSYYAQKLHKVSVYNPFVELLSEFACTV